MKRLVPFISAAIAAVTLGSVHTVAQINRSGPPVAVATLTNCELSRWGAGGPVDFETVHLPSKSLIFTKEGLAKMGIDAGETYQSKRAFILFSTHPSDHTEYLQQSKFRERVNPIRNKGYPTAIAAHFHKSGLHPLEDKDHFIAEGVLTLANVQRTDKQLYEFRLARTDLAVPAAYQNQITPRKYDPSPCTPKQQVTITFGNKGIPWISNVTAIDD